MSDFVICNFILCYNIKCIRSRQTVKWKRNKTPIYFANQTQLPACIMSWTNKSTLRMYIVLALGFLDCCQKCHLCKVPPRRMLFHCLCIPHGSAEGRKDKYFVTAEVQWVLFQRVIGVLHRCCIQIIDIPIIVCQREFRFPQLIWCSAFQRSRSNWVTGACASAGNSIRRILSTKTTCYVSSVVADETVKLLGTVQCHQEPYWSPSLSSGSKKIRIYNGRAHLGL